jgi:hypothetical protein
VRRRREGGKREEKEKEGKGKKRKYGKKIKLENFRGEK